MWAKRSSPKALLWFLDAFMCVLSQSSSDTNYDRTTSEMSGSSPKIISGDSRWSENAQTHTHKHTVPNTKFKLKLLQIKCHVLGFITGKAQNMLQKIIRVFVEAFVSLQDFTVDDAERETLVSNAFDAAQDFISSYDFTSLAESDNNDNPKAYFLYIDNSCIREVYWTTDRDLMAYCLDDTKGWWHQLSCKNFWKLD
jgi:hypothetical protein